MAHCVDSLRCEGSDAIGGTTDIDWPPAPISSEAYDPEAVLPVDVKLHCNKRPSAYSITSSARSRIDCGIVRLSALAVLALTAISNLTGT